MATNSSILAWQIPWTVGWQKVGHDRATKQQQPPSDVMNSSSIHISREYDRLPDFSEIMKKETYMLNSVRINYSSSTFILQWFKHNVSISKLH